MEKLLIKMPQSELISFDNFKQEQESGYSKCYVG